MTFSNIHGSNKSSATGLTLSSFHYDGTAPNHIRRNKFALENKKCSPDNRILRLVRLTANELFNNLHSSLIMLCFLSQTSINLRTPDVLFETYSKLAEKLCRLFFRLALFLFRFVRRSTGEKLRAAFHITKRTDTGRGRKEGEIMKKHTRNCITD